MRGCTLDQVRPLPNCFRALNLAILNPDQQVPIYCEWVAVQTTCLSTSTGGQGWGLVYGSKVQSITVSTDLDSLWVSLYLQPSYGVCPVVSRYPLWLPLVWFTSLIAYTCSMELWSICCHESYAQELWAYYTKRKLTPPFYISAKSFLILRISKTVVH